MNAQDFALSLEVVVSGMECVSITVNQVINAETTGTIEKPLATMGFVLSSQN